jgi:glycosyltransferase involved in cell wall biosynthesis
MRLCPGQPYQTSISFGGGHICDRPNGDAATARSDAAGDERRAMASSGAIEPRLGPDGGDDSARVDGGSTQAQTIVPVTILLCTFNGGRFLEEQLASIASQSYPHWQIIASDDGSTDTTLALLGSFVARQGDQRRVEIRKGPDRGPTANFLSLAADPAIDGAYFAYCDQDDVWYRDKLERAIVWLASVAAEVPALYCARTTLIDAGGRYIGRSPLFRKAPDFRNALVQSVAGANTMVFNRAARALLIAAGNCDVVAHDWWTYLLVSGAEGSVYYDPIPSVAYRQHRANQIGSNNGLLAVLWRLTMFLRGEWTRWNDRNAAALARCSCLLTATNRGRLAAFSVLRRGSLIERLRAWRQLGLYRQTRTGQMMLMFAMIFKRI